MNDQQSNTLVVFGQWFLWAVFRLLALAGILLFALIIAPLVFAFLLDDNGTMGASNGGIAIGFVGIVIGVIVAQFAQVIQEVNTHHFRYPLASNALGSGSAESAPNPQTQSVPTGQTPMPNGGNQNPQQTRPFSWQDFWAVIIPLILLIGSVVLLLFLEADPKCGANRAHGALILIASIVALASALGTIVYLIVRGSKAS